MKLLSLTALVTLIGISAALSQTASEGRALAELSFASVDSNENGSIDMGESHNFGEDVFVSMDSDDDIRVSEAEFLSWGYGFENLADDRDKELAYRTALRVVFSFWDRNVDGEISPTEHRVALNRDFRRADLNGDALLSKEEFLGGFSVMVATISSAPGEEHLRFTVKVLGDWTRKVREELAVGGEVLVRGPYGCFDTHGAGNKQIWLAGGVGLTPFLSMIRAMQPGDQRNIHLVYAARDEKDAIFLEELRARAKELGNVTIVSLLSDEGNFARVDIMKTKLPDPLDTYEYFLCGPKPMTEALMRDLKKEAVPRTQIHTEAFEFR